MPETVTIIVNQDGSTTVGVECIKGTACKDATREIEKALGRTTSDQPTSEMKEKSHVAHRR
jgi:Tfp pilus assembly protein PilZ